MIRVDVRVKVCFVVSLVCDATHLLYLFEEDIQRTFCYLRHLRLIG